MTLSRHVLIPVILLALGGAPACDGDPARGGGIGSLDAAGGPGGADGAPVLPDAGDAGPSGPDAGGDLALPSDAAADGAAAPDAIADAPSPGDAAGDAAADGADAPDAATGADGADAPGPDGAASCLPDPCAAGTVCVEGECLPACAVAARLGAHIGCTFWTVDLDQYPDPFVAPPPDELPHGVIVHNPGAVAAEVTFTTEDAVTVVVADPTVPPGEARSFVMPRQDVDGSGVSWKSVRMETTQPVAAWQMSPFGEAGFSSDGSLLLPDHALGRRYVVASWQSSPEIAVLELPAQKGYVTVVATSPGSTDVTVRVACDTVEGPGVPALTAGSERTFTLDQFQVLNLEAQASPAGGTAVQDLTGSSIEATQPIAVFGGHEEAVVAADPTGGHDACCADHLEEQLFPLSLWATAVVCAKAPPRGSPIEPDLWRVFSGAAGNTLTTDPPVAGLDGVTLGEGQWVEVASPTSFAVHGTGPLLAVQLLVGQEQTSQRVGDPALVTAVPVPLYRAEQWVVVPDWFSGNWGAVVRPAGVPVFVDGEPVGETFEAIGDGPWEVGWIALEPGLRQVTAAEPFGMTVFGWDDAASYGFPAGLGAAR